MKLSDILGDAFEEPVKIKIPKFSKSSGPVNIDKNNEWKTYANPNRLVRMFKFDDESKFNSFVLDLLELQSRTAHHGRITLQYPKIKVEIWTHTLMEITDVDIEWSRKVSDIYGDYK